MFPKPLHLLKFNDNLEKRTNGDHCSHPRTWIQLFDNIENLVYQAYCETCGEMKNTFKEIFFNQSQMNRTTQCDCGEEKPAQYPTCYDCKVKNLKPDEICACGKPKQSKYPNCYACSKQNR